MLNSFHLSYDRVDSRLEKQNPPRNHTAPQTQISFTNATQTEIKTQLPFIKSKIPSDKKQVINHSRNLAVVD